ncbi:TPA: hypothetical protein DEO28_04785 [Candidatus Dependentiae bacterium]|nr:MAG: hypothetical protein UR14_C0002G0071 [candidate division TM6 bacterium GW2011_GWE2_31_21]KKP53868.1 MAG: hypothetical protein UR43_C0002G0071 [candidate division TM6 bacterium GW2011_GWF2_33_332]HBS47648.1 hypothetical protein [Candidatus Dependentiae bacterium]HBZ73797.1 hypothetical protein [Candidatus Dependentiae bacterium]
MKKIVGFISITIFLVLVIFLFSMRFLNLMPNEAKHNLFLQMPLELQVIKDLQNRLDPIVNKIVEDEMKIPRDKNLPIFFFKKRQAITVYYLYDMNVVGESVLFSELDFLQTIISAPKNVIIKPQVNFFGDVQAPLIDLVVFVDDPNKELLSLNEQFKKMVALVNVQYKSLYKIDLYNVAKSECFEFKPHLSLGHLRVEEIKKLIKYPAQAEVVIDRIKSRILEVVSKALSELTLKNRKVQFNTLAVYDQQKRVYIKEYKFL